MHPVSARALAYFDDLFPDGALEKSSGTSETGENANLRARKQVTPIATSTTAKPHRAVYRMHRYFARRPDSVFADLVNHYSDPGDVILDPFAGGGVTLVEAVRQGRRAIGFDTNPLAVFITRMELVETDIPAFEEEAANVLREFADEAGQLFITDCRECGRAARAFWFEYSHRAECKACSFENVISTTRKVGVGTWECSCCSQPIRFSPRADDEYALVAVHYRCDGCDAFGTAPPNDADIDRLARLTPELTAAESEGLSLPAAPIPSCNMERESALHKKGFVMFRQFFTTRHLLALGRLRQIIMKREGEMREALLFAFSSTLRYTNRMVTRNPGWRGDRPLEWAKPGYWIPPVFVEADVAEEFSRRCRAVRKGKTDAANRPPAVPAAREVSHPGNIVDEAGAAFHISCRSSTDIPLDDQTVDVIITDPPYGSYVHYADLSNFWSAWLEGVPGLGGIIDDSEEAVVARKQFPGAKKLADYQALLEKCFCECSRVLKSGGYMVLTFNNREPRAWVALILAALKAGFHLPDDGVVFQHGIAAYKHTAQSRRVGSVIGDFIFSFRKGVAATPQESSSDECKLGDDHYLSVVREVLATKGPLDPNSLLTELHIALIPELVRRAHSAISVGEVAMSRLLEEMNEISLFDSHRRPLLERHFAYEDGRWSLREAA